MNERDFIDLAQLLLAHNTEAAWRSAISRAYDAAFHVARRLLTSMNFGIPRADRAHAYLWMHLATSGDEMRREERDTPTMAPGIRDGLCRKELL